MAYLDKIRNWSAAIAFAEVGEFDTAREVAQIPLSTGPARRTVFDTMEKMAVAVAFAEGGLFKEASDLVTPAPIRERSANAPSFLELVGLEQAPVRMYVMTN